MRRQKQRDISYRRGLMSFTLKKLMLHSVPRKATWVKEGENNSSCFFNLVKIIRQVQMAINKLFIDNCSCEGQDKIDNHIACF